MAKRSRRRPVRNDGHHQLGCMWGLMNMFDFRYARSPQRLLSDKKHYCKQTVDGNQKRKLDESACSDKSCHETHDDGYKKASVDTYKPSMKKLIEEEMFKDQEDVKQGRIKEVTPKQSDIDPECRQKKSRRKARTRSCDGIIVSSNTVDNFGLECHHSSEIQPTSSLDLDNMMEEFCRRIRQESTSCCVQHEHELPEEVHSQLNGKNGDFKEKLSEVVKFLISQKLANRKKLPEGDENQSSKDFMEALQMLGSDEELFLKLLQDPDSLLDVHHAHVVKEENQKNSVARFNLLEKDAQHDVHASRKHQHRNFFGRRAKSQERISFDETNSIRNVSLKPGSRGMLSSTETTESLAFSSEPRCTLKSDGHSPRASSHFFLSEIKRKLKHVMGKEQNRGQTDNTKFNGASHEGRELGNSDRTRNCVSKERFFTERIAKPANGVKKGGKMSNLKDLEIVTEEHGSYPKQRVPNIYIEAKKHLAEILRNGNENMEFSSTQPPRLLGRILSLPEYNSPVPSPRQTYGPILTIPTTKVPTSKDLEKVTDSIQRTHPNNPDENAQKVENLPYVSDEKTDDSLKASYKGNAEIVEVTDVIIQGESTVVDTLPEPDCSSVNVEGQSDDILEVHDEKTDSECLKQEALEETQPQSPPPASSSESFIDKFGSADIPERPSPISVLEPMFTEESISPPSTRPHSVEFQLQPLQIQFEDHESSDENEHNDTKTCLCDKELISEYAKAVLKVSGLAWDELYMKSLSSDQLLESSLIDDVEFFLNQLSPIQKVLFDCINEVLTELCGHQFGCAPWVSFVKPKVWPIPQMEEVTKEVQERVYRHFVPLPQPRTLDQIVRKDMDKSETWMDCRLDTECIGVEMDEEILDELMEETIECCLYSQLPAEMKEDLVVE